VSNFRLPISSSEFPTVCEPCQLGKSRRLPFSHSHVSSSSPFQLIYSYVWGPSPVSSINGSSYFVLFIDDCTKFIWIYFMSHKSQVFQLFTQFKALIETQFGTKIKSVQTDGEVSTEMYRLFYKIMVLIIVSLVPIHLNKMVHKNAEIEL